MENVEGGMQSIRPIRGNYEHDAKTIRDGFLHTLTPTVQCHGKKCLFEELYMLLMILSFLLLLNPSKTSTI